MVGECARGGAARGGGVGFRYAGSSEPRGSVPAVLLATVNLFLGCGLTIFTVFVSVGDCDCAFGLLFSLFGSSHAATSNAATHERCAVRDTQGRLRVYRYLFGHAGFSGTLLEGNSGARAFVGSGATRGRLFAERGFFLKR